MSFTGVALIALGTSRHGLSAGWGAALCIIAAAVYAVGVVAQKPALRYGSPLAVTWLACAIGAVCCLPYAPELVHQLGHVHGAAVAWTVYLGLVPTAIGFSTWAYALARTDAGQAGLDDLPRAADRGAAGLDHARRGAAAGGPSRAGSSAWPGWVWPAGPRAGAPRGRAAPRPAAESVAVRPPPSSER